MTVSATTALLVTLSATNPLALALNKVLPVSGLGTTWSSFFYQTVKEAVLIAPPLTEGHLVTCKTVEHATRAPDPVPHFTGCTVTVVQDDDFAIPVMTWDEVFQAAAALDTPSQPVPVK